MFEAFMQVAPKAAPGGFESHTETEWKSLYEVVKSYIENYGVLTPLTEDPTITEIMVNGPSEIWVENHEGLFKTDLFFPDEASLRRTLTKIASSVNRRIDEASPILDCRLQDGSRVNATLSPPTINGPSLTIRKFPEDSITIDKLIEFGSLTPQAAKFLEYAVDAALNVLVVGGTGSGKLLSVNTDIPTSKGLVKLGDVEVGDILFDEQGQPTAIQGIFEPIPESVYTVKFDDGTEVIACGDHLWETSTEVASQHAGSSGQQTVAQVASSVLQVLRPHEVVKKVESSVVTTTEISQTLPAKHFIPVSGVWVYPKAEPVEDPYDTGLLNALMNWEISDSYMRANEAERRALLAGLMDLKGAVNLITGMCEFHATDQLVKQVRHLASSLGYKTQMQLSEGTGFVTFFSEGPVFWDENKE